MLKLRIKYPSGAEFEAEGPPDFISRQKRDFLFNIAGIPGGEPPGKFPAWGEIIANKGNICVLKARFPEIEGVEAALLIIAANQIECKNKSVSAITLSKALKLSGYKTARVDRLLAGEIKSANVISSGTKRNRVYSLSPKGMEKSSIILRKIESVINP